MDNHYLPRICGISLRSQSLPFPVLTRRKPAYHKHTVFSEFYYCLYGSHDDYFATMYYDGRYKIVNFHGKECGELYDLEKDPEKFHNLWDEPEYHELKCELTKKNFNHAILKNLDYSMNRIHGF